MSNRYNLRNRAAAATNNGTQITAIQNTNTSTVEATVDTEARSYRDVLVPRPPSVAERDESPRGDAVDSEKIQNKFFSFREKDQSESDSSSGNAEDDRPWQV
ncbi:hypothetical protein H0H81_008242, partial [Sphagnurus paluster]